jgi:hypothetical protein
VEESKEKTEDGELEVDESEPESESNFRKSDPIERLVYGISIEQVQAGSEGKLGSTNFALYIHEPARYSYQHDRLKGCAGGSSMSGTHRFSSVLHSPIHNKVSNLTAGSFRFQRPCEVRVRQTRRGNMRLR